MSSEEWRFLPTDRLVWPFPIKEQVDRSQPSLCAFGKKFTVNNSLCSLPHTYTHTHNLEMWASEWVGWRQPVIR